MGEGTAGVWSDTVAHWCDFYHCCNHHCATITTATNSATTTIASTLVLLWLPLLCLRWCDHLEKLAADTHPTRDNIRTLSQNNPLCAQWIQEICCAGSCNLLHQETWVLYVVMEIRCPVAIGTVRLWWQRFCVGIRISICDTDSMCTDLVTMTNHMVNVCLFWTKSCIQPHWGPLGGEQTH